MYSVASLRHSQLKVNDEITKRSLQNVTSPYQSLAKVPDRQQASVMWHSQTLDRRALTYSNEGIPYLHQYIVLILYLTS